jgi:hypothetical protein
MRSGIARILTDESRLADVALKKVVLQDLLECQHFRRNPPQPLSVEISGFSHFFGFERGG